MPRLLALVTIYFFNAISRPMTVISTGIAFAWLLVANKLCFFLDFIDLLGFGLQLLTFFWNAGYGLGRWWKLARLQFVLHGVFSFVR